MQLAWVVEHSVSNICMCQGVQSLAPNIFLQEWLWKWAACDRTKLQNCSCTSTQLSLVLVWCWTRYTCWYFLLIYSFLLMPSLLLRCARCGTCFLPRHFPSTHNFSSCFLHKLIVIEMIKLSHFSLSQQHSYADLQFLELCSSFGWMGYFSLCQQRKLLPPCIFFRAVDLFNISSNTKVWIGWQKAQLKQLPTRPLISGQKKIVGCTFFVLFFSKMNSCNVWSGGYICLLWRLYSSHSSCDGLLLQIPLPVQYATICPKWLPDSGCSRCSFSVHFSVMCKKKCTVCQHLDVF